MTTMIKHIIAIGLFTIAIMVEAAEPSFSRSKELLQEAVYYDHLITFKVVVNNRRASGLKRRI